MDLIIRTAGVTDLSAAAVTSASDLTALTPPDDFPQLALGSTEPITIKFVAAASTYESWSDDPAYSVMVSLGCVTADGTENYAEATLDTIISDGKSGDLNLDTTALNNALGAYFLANKRRATMRLVLSVAVTDGDGDRRVYAMLPIDVWGRVSSYTPDAANNPPALQPVLASRGGALSSPTNFFSASGLPVVYSVINYGTPTDGTTEAAAGFNRAIDAASEAGGGIVYVPVGIYKVSGTTGNTIYIKSNVVLEFEPGCTITSGIPSGTSHIISVDSIEESNIANALIKGNGLKIYGDKTTGVVQYGLSVNVQDAGDTVFDVVFSGIRIFNCRTDGITIGGNAGLIPERITFRDVVSDGCYRNGGSLAQGSAIRFSDCRFRNTSGAAPQAGFDVEPDAGLSVLSVDFDRCEFESNAGVGCYIQNGNGTTLAARVTNSRSYSNAAEGFAFSLTGKLVCDNLESYGNTTRGYLFQNAGRTAASNLIAHSNGTVGFFFAGAGALTAGNCIAYSNTQNGFTISTLASITGQQVFTGCTADGNTTKGFIVTGASGAVLNGCTAKNNAQDGFVVTHSDHCQLNGPVSIGNSTASDAGGDNIIFENNANYNQIDGALVRMSDRFFRGTATAGSTTTATLPATRNTQTDDFYAGKTLRVLSGSGNGQSAVITGYVAATGVVTFATQSVALANDSVVEITNGNRARYGLRIAAGCTGNKVTDNDCYYGGTTGAFSDGGTSTVTTSANRTS